MLCHECQQNNATLHFTKIVNGKKTQISLCESCASEKGNFFTYANNFSINNLLSGLLNFDQPLSGSSKHNSAQSNYSVRCEGCGITFHEFSQSGNLGCARCYTTFRDKLIPILRRVHGGNSKHGGKIPKRIGGHLQVQRDIDELKRQLRQSIANEEFEKAAVIRDTIREMELKMQTGGEE